jgi:hypothetical protein
VSERRELLGGEEITIFHAERAVHTFRRAMADALLAHLDAEEYPGPVIDLWRIVTPMSARQQKRLPPLPKLDDSADLEEQTAFTWNQLRRIDMRAQINSRTDGVESDETYELGYGIPRIGKPKLWRLLDGFCRVGIQEITAQQLTDAIARVGSRDT